MSRLVSIFASCCKARGRVGAGPCDNVPRIVHALQGGNVHYTMTSGGSSRRIRDLSGGLFPNLFSVSVKEGSGVTVGPSPRVVLSVTHRLKVGTGRVICVNSSRISVVAKGGKKFPDVSIT